MYKRQVLDGADLAALPGTGEALAAALNRDGWAVVRNPDPAAVSYTHLDVYKRQPWPTA